MVAPPGRARQQKAPANGCWDIMNDKLPCADGLGEVVDTQGVIAVPQWHAMLSDRAETQERFFCFLHVDVKQLTVDVSDRG